MYDFTSGRILDVVKTALTGKDLNLVLDHPPKDRTADQTNEETHAELAAALGDGMTFAWALDRNDPMALAWIFPSAYHIKAAVRDGAAFWPSSGNWNNSNEPDIDPFRDPAGAAPIARNPTAIGTQSSSTRDSRACSRPISGMTSMSRASIRLRLRPAWTSWRR